MLCNNTDRQGLDLVCQYAVFLVPCHISFVSFSRSVVCFAAHVSLVVVLPTILRDIWDSCLCITVPTVG